MKAVCSGFVVRTFPFGDTGLIVKVLDKSGLFYSFLVKGAKKRGKNSLPGYFSPMSHVQISFSERENKSLFTAHSVTAGDIFPSVHHDMEKMSVAMYWAEALYRLHPEEQSDEELYRVVHTYMQQLDEGQNLVHLPQAFLCSLINLMGVTPQGRFSAETPCFSLPFHSFCEQAFNDPANTLKGPEAEYISVLFQGGFSQESFGREVRRSVRRRLEEYIRLHLNPGFNPVSGEVLETVFD